ncbi:hypothetical protein CGRA01v4_01749 [Colletotrichum graminicola]|nr:hypothetical protein CGRA01v4_01749 [Colletotrichum graminicola]
MPALTFWGSDHSPLKQFMIDLLFPTHVCNHPLPGRSYVKQRRQKRPDLDCSFGRLGRNCAKKVHVWYNWPSSVTPSWSYHLCPITVPLSSPIATSWGVTVCGAAVLYTGSAPRTYKQLGHLDPQPSRRHQRKLPSSYQTTRGWFLDEKLQILGCFLLCY